MMNAWKTYFWFVSLVTALSMLFLISANIGLFPSISEEIDWTLDTERWYSLAFIVVTLIPLFGISYKKSILKVLIWKILFILQFCVFIWEYFDIKPELIAEPLSPYSISAVIALLVFTIPTIIANYIYAFKSDTIWQLQTNT